MDTESDEPSTVETGVFPDDLVEVEQWLAWKETGDGHKVPRAPWTGGNPSKPISAQDPEVWTDFETAADWCSKLPDFELEFNIRDREEHPEEEYVLVDCDDARDPATGAIHPNIREHLDRAESYGDVSTSGTGVHIFCRGGLPDGVTAIEAPLPTAEGFADAEIEVYDFARFSAMTGDHLAGTPQQTMDSLAFLDDLAEEFATVTEGTPDKLLREPETPKAELADIETTDDIQDVFDAIQHTGPRDIRLRSTVTQERADGSTSLDPSWAASESGTHHAQVDDGWVYRKGMVGLDAVQVVAFEEQIIHDVKAYPTGEDFWRAVDALRDRDAHIPEYEPPESDWFGEGGQFPIEECAPPEEDIQEADVDAIRAELAGEKFDDVQAAAMQAIAVPAVIEDCPWCGSQLDLHNGARHCSSNTCDWDERERTLTRRDGERARALASIETDGT